MPELPKISEDFTADPSGYLAALQAMIDKTKELIDQVNELHRVIDELPDVKNIEINVTGNAVDTIDRIKADLSTLDNTTVTVNVIYKNIGGPEGGVVTSVVTGAGGGTTGGGGSTGPDPAVQLDADTRILTEATRELADATRELIDETALLDLHSVDLTVATEALEATTAPLVPATQELVGATNELTAATNRLTAATNREKDETSKEVVQQQIDVTGGGTEKITQQITETVTGPGIEQLKQEAAALNKIAEANKSVAESAREVRSANTGEADSISLVGAANTALQRALGDENTTLSQLKNQVKATTEALREARIAGQEDVDTSTLATAADELLSRAQSGVGVTATQAKNALNAVTEAKRELRLATEAQLQAQAQSAAADQEEADRLAELSNDEQTLTNLRRIGTEIQIQRLNADKMAAQSARLLADTEEVLKLRTVENTAAIRQMRDMIAAGGGDTVVFTKSMAEGDNSMRAFALAAHAVQGGVGGMLIPLNAARFGITGWATALHLVVMGAFEFLAVFIPAMYAAAAAAAVLAQGIMEKVVPHIKSLYTATESLGPMFNTTAGDMLGMGHSLQTAQDLANPMAYTLLGEAIIGLRSASDIGKNGLSAFGQMGFNVGTMLEQFGAKLDVDIIQNMPKIRSVVAGAVSDLQGFGQMLGNIGHAILNLAAAMPGLAEIILKLIDGVTSLIKWVSGLNPVFIAVVMGIEEAYRWSGLLVGAFGLLGRAMVLVGTLGIPVFAKIGGNIAKMIGGIVSGMAGLVAHIGDGVAAVVGLFSNKMADGVAKGASGIVSKLGAAAAFLEGPWGIAIGLGAAAVGILVLAMLHYKDATTQFIDSTQKTIQAASNLTVLNTIANTMAQNQVKLTAATKDYNTQMGNQGAISQAATSNNLRFAQSMGDLTGSAGKAGETIRKLSSNQQNLVQESSNVIAGAGAISQKYGVDFTGALGLADMAGVKLVKGFTGQSTAARQAQIQVAALVLGYQRMDQTGTTLANSMNAVYIQSSLQTTKVQQLNQAWDQFISMSTSLTGSFTQFNLDLQQMGNQAATVGSKIIAFRGDTQLSVSQIAAALKSFSGSSAQTWQAFNQSVSQANTFMDSLRTAAAAGVVTQGQFRQAIASVVGQLLPYASQSSAALAEVRALASEAGGPASGSFQSLKNWVDQNSLSSSKFTGLIDSLTVKLSNVTQVAKNFAGTLQSDVINAMAQAGVNTSNITGLTQKYTQELAANGAQNVNTMVAQGNLTKALQGYGFTNQAIQQVEDQLISIYGKHETASNHLKGASDQLNTQANILANSFGITLPGALGKADSASDNTKNGHLSPLQRQAYLNKHYTDMLADSFGANLPSGLGKANSAMDGSKNAHLSPLQQLINAINRNTNTMIGTFKRWPTSEHTNVALSASGSATVKSNVQGVQQGLVRIFAAGGVVPGYEPGHDTVHALLSKGEGVLVPQAVRMLGGEHGINALNKQAQRFADGGVATPSTSYPKPFYTAAFDVMTNGVNIIGQTFAKIMAESMKAVTQQSQAGINGRSMPGHPSGTFLQWLATAMRLAGVGGANWQFGLEEIAMHESGFNPNAINLSDSNAAAGDPSRGLMQLIMTTFDAYHVSGTSNNIYDPVANIAAAIRYILARYGSINNVPGVASLAHGGPYVGYDSGGLLMPGITMAYNGTGKPETVTPAGAGEPGMVHTEIHIDGKKIAEAVTPYYYQKAARNNGNANAGKYWAPGNR